MKDRELKIEGVNYDYIEDNTEYYKVYFSGTFTKEEVSELFKDKKVKE